MSRPIGLAKTGGRQKGTPNKKTESLFNELKENGIDIPTLFAEAFPSLKPETKMHFLLQIMPYIYPKRKPEEPETDLNELFSTDD